MIRTTFFSQNFNHTDLSSILIERNKKFPSQILNSLITAAQKMNKGKEMDAEPFVIMAQNEYRGLYGQTKAPDYNFILLVCGQFYLQTGEYEKARKALEKLDNIPEHLPVKNALMEQLDRRMVNELVTPDKINNGSLAPS